MIEVMHECKTKDVGLFVVKCDDCNLKEADLKIKEFFLKEKKYEGFKVKKIILFAIIDNFKIFLVCLEDIKGGEDGNQED